MLAENFKEKCLEKVIPTEHMFNAALPIARSLSIK